MPISFYSFRCIKGVSFTHPQYPERYTSLAKLEADALSVMGDSEIPYNDSTCQNKKKQFSVMKQSLSTCNLVSMAEAAAPSPVIGDIPPVSQTCAISSLHLFIKEKWLEFQNQQHESCISTDGEPELGNQSL